MRKIGLHGLMVALETESLGSPINWAPDRISGWGEPARKVATLSRSTDSHMSARLAGVLRPRRIAQFIRRNVATGPAEGQCGKTRSV